MAKLNVISKIDDGEHVGNNADTETPETPFPV